MKKNLVSIVAFAAFQALFALPQFTVQPTLVQEGPARWWVEFTVNEAVDVEVAIIDTVQKTIVRHLAAGVLGPAAPAPLVADSLHQKIEWEGTDDLGVAVTSTDNLAVRVRAGLSAALDGFAGENNYAYYCTNEYPISNLRGIAVDTADGSLYVMATSHIYTQHLRKYDAEGNYVRTVFPFPAGLDPAGLTGYGINLLPDGSAQPRTTAIAGPAMGSAFLTNGGTLMLPFVRNGELMFLNPMWYFSGWDMAMLSMKTDSRLTMNPAHLFSGRTGINKYVLGGSIYATLSADGQSMLLSGYYQTDADSGLWKAGQVYKVVLSTGAVSSLIRLDAVVKNTDVVHGTAVDDSGHIFVCDRLHNEIGVYDTLGNRVGGFAVQNPDMVAVDKSNRIYVATRSQVDVWSGMVSIHRYDSWRNTPSAAVSLRNIITKLWTRSINVRMALTRGNGHTRLWLASFSAAGDAQQNNVWLIEDTGDSLKVIRTFADSAKDANRGFERPKVDARTETVYFTNSWDWMYKIKDWSNPVLVLCSTSLNQPLKGCDMNISPNGHLYVRAPSTNQPNGFNGPIKRYTLDDKPAPVPFLNSGTNVMTPDIYGRFGWAYGDRGLAVDNDGRLATLAMTTIWTTASEFYVGIFGDSTTPDTGVVGSYDSATMTHYGRKAVYPVSASCGGVEFDLKGNLYIGAVGHLPDQVVPQGFENDLYYKNNAGSVMKFDPDGPLGSVRSKGCSVDVDSIVNAIKVYPAPLTGLNQSWVSGINCTTGDNCACRSPRFDVDGYGRLFVPNPLASRIAVIDNEGNSILTFGQYGNTDSRGPGSLVPTVDVPFAFPSGVAASDNYMYVTDMINMRLVRVRMDYALNSLPGAVTTVAEKQGGNPGRIILASAPNPFNPESRISISLPEKSNVRLDVYDVAGRFVKNLLNGEKGQGRHQLVWNATDSRNRPVSAGLYVYRLAAGKQVLVRRTVLAK